MPLRAGTQPPVDELADLQASLPGAVEEAVRAFAACVARAHAGGRDRATERRCLERLAATLATAGAFADVLGRARALRELKAAGPRRFAAPQRDPTAAPRAGLLKRLLGLGFDAAVASLVERVPEVARDRAAIEAVYRRGGFALVRSADLATTAAVQEQVAKAVARGEARPTVERVMEALDASFVRPYAALVFRNATTRAYAAGRMRQARELPGVVGFEFQTAGDVDVRPNHAAADGLIMGLEDPALERLSPPLGHLDNCRCALKIVSRVEAERRKLLRPDGTLPPARVPAGAKADEGFVVTRADDVYRGAPATSALAG